MESYDAVFERLQQYVPILQERIAKLPISAPQREKMVALEGIITNAEKKYKIETLLRCEEVIKKLQSTTFFKKPVSEPGSSCSISSTTDQINQKKPICEPVATYSNAASEQTISSPDLTSEEYPQVDRYVCDAPSVYAMAADTINKPKVVNIPIPGLVTTKPPINIGDLQCEPVNSADIDRECESILNASKDVKKHKVPSKVSLVPAPVNIKPKTKNPAPVVVTGNWTVRQPDKKPTTASQPKVDKIVESNNSMFGSFLSKIDESLMGKEKKRRDSKSKERDNKKKDGDKSKGDKTEQKSRDPRQASEKHKEDNKRREDKSKHKGHKSDEKRSSTEEKKHSSGSSRHHSSSSNEKQSESSKHKQPKKIADRRLSEKSNSRHKNKIISDAIESSISYKAIPFLEDVGKEKPPCKPQSKKPEEYQEKEQVYPDGDIVDRIIQQMARQEEPEVRSPEPPPSPEPEVDVSEFSNFPKPVYPSSAKNDPRLMQKKPVPPTYPIPVQPPVQNSWERDPRLNNRNPTSYSRPNLHPIHTPSNPVYPMQKPNFRPQLPPNRSPYHQNNYQQQRQPIMPSNMHIRPFSPFEPLENQKNTYDQFQSRNNQSYGPNAHNQCTSYKDWKRNKAMSRDPRVKPPYTNQKPNNTTPQRNNKGFDTNASNNRSRFSDNKSKNIPQTSNSSIHNFKIPKVVDKSCDIIEIIDLDPKTDNIVDNEIDSDNAHQEQEKAETPSSTKSDERQEHPSSSTQAEEVVTKADIKEAAALNVESREDLLKLLGETKLINFLGSIANLLKPGNSDENVPEAAKRTAIPSGREAAEKLREFKKKRKIKLKKALLLKRKLAIANRSKLQKAKGKKVDNAKKKVEKENKPEESDISETETSMPPIEVAKPKIKKRKNELDILHEDIKETMGENVLATHPKRSCTMQSKEQPAVVKSAKAAPKGTVNNTSPPSPKKRGRKRKVPVEEPSPPKEKPAVVAETLLPKRKSSLRAAKQIASYAELNENEFSKSDESDSPPSVEPPPNNVHSEDKTFIEPDKNYYFSSLIKQCKVCKQDFDNLPQHYKRAHSDHEVYVSRLSPSRSDNALTSAVKNKIEHFVIPNIPNKRFTFKCRFCDEFFKKVSVGNFISHVCTHTGEARYKCGHCDFKTSNLKYLRKHVSDKHKSKNQPNDIIDLLTRPNNHILFGYICSECNYLQLNKKSVEDHIQIYHLDDTAKACVVNMSSECNGPSGSEDGDSHSTNATPNGDEGDSSEEELVMPKPMKVEAIDANDNVSADMNAFVCEDLPTVEEGNLENYEEKIKQIQASVIPTKRMSIVNELQDRLSRPQDDEVDVNTARIDIVEAINCHLPNPEFVCKYLKCIFKSCIRSRFAAHCNLMHKQYNAPLTCQYCDVKDVMTFEEKFYHLCQHVDNNDHVSKDAADADDGDHHVKTMNVAYIQVKSIDDGNNQFTCKVPNCEYSTEIRNDFEIHCIDNHAQVSDSAMCDICDTTETMTMHQMLLHLCMHLGNEEQDSLILKCEPDDEPQPQFNIKIVSVESLANKDAGQSNTNKELAAEKSVDSAMSKQDDFCRVTCKLVPMQQSEISTPRKSVLVLQAWLNGMNIGDLFKCPVMVCPYSSNNEMEFESHIRTHSNIDAYLPCLYCNFKMKMEFVRIHYLIRHSDSLYGCAYCLYRALEKEYVLAHQEQQHASSQISIRVFEAPEITTQFYKPTPPPIKTVLRRYDCSCGAQYVAIENFEKHLSGCKSSIIDNFTWKYRCGQCPETFSSSQEVIKHNEQHEIFEFACRYCNFGAADQKQMMIHFAMDHCFYSVNAISRHIKEDQIMEQEDDSIYEKLVISCAHTNDRIPQLKPLDGNDEFLERIQDTPDNPQRGLQGADLFKCHYCMIGFDTSAILKGHLLSCLDIDKSIICPHCKRVCKSVSNLIDHIRIHGVPRIACSLCPYKHAHQWNLRSHMRSRHKINSCVMVPVYPNKCDIDTDEFIARPGNVKSADLAVKDPPQIDEFKPKIKTTFSPTEIDQLPFKPIFSTKVFCSICQYSTKVKSNFVRHLMMHGKNVTSVIPASAPINPVPCLEKNELMFDKMTNLALSSHSSGRMGGVEIKTDKQEINIKIPDFIPVTKRYVCGANGCNYLCLEDDMLQWHWKSLHKDEKDFTCTHCNELINDVNNFEKISHHLRLHDQNLYKCYYCDFMFNNKAKIERHCTDKHPNSAFKIIQIRELIDSISNSDNNEAYKIDKEKKKQWKCVLCKSKYVNEKEVKTHIVAKHNLDSQYKCSYCNYKSGNRDSFSDHFKQQHAGYVEDVIVVYYKEEEIKEDNNDNFDTTPLWTKNKTNIKHIRGILLEDQEKVVKKNVIKTTPFTERRLSIKSNQVSNLDLSIEAVAAGTDTDTDIKTTVKDELPELKVIDTKTAINTNEQPPTPTPTPTPADEVNDDDIFGKPENEKYKCSLCADYSSTIRNDFIIHLCKELNYLRFTCNVCKAPHPNYLLLQKHIVRDHKVKVEDMAAQNEPTEQWIKKAVSHQQSLIKRYKNMPAASQKQYKTRNSSDGGQLQVLLYPGDVPLRCAYCDYADVHKKRIILHLRLKHPTMRIDYKIGSNPHQANVEQVFVKNDLPRSPQKQTARKSTTPRNEVALMKYCKLTRDEIDRYKVRLSNDSIIEMKDAMRRYDLFPSVVIVRCSAKLLQS